MAFGLKRRVRTILQGEANECGLACLAMIANYHGHSIDLPYMRALNPTAARGSSMASLAHSAAAFELEAKGYAVSQVSDLAMLTLPAILHWDGVHFVVLEKVSAGRFTIHDPGFGKRLLDEEDFMRMFSGVALEFEPRTTFAKVEGKSQLGLFDLLTHVRGFKGAVVKVIIVSMAISLLSLATPILLLVALDIVLPQADLNLLGLLCFGLVVLLLFDAVGRWLRDVIVLRSSLSMQMQVSRGLVGHGFRLPLGFFERRHAGDIVARMDSVEEIKEFATNGMVIAFADSLTSIATIILMFYYSPALTFVVLGTFAAVIVVRFIFFGTVQRHTTESLTAKSEETASLIDGINCVATHKTHNTTSAFAARWYETMFVFANQDFRSRKVQIDAQFFVHAAVVIGTVLTLYMGVAAVIANLMTIGMLYAFFALRSTFFETVDTLSENLMELSMLGAHVQRIGDIITEAPEVNSNPTTIKRAIRQGIALRDVSVRFPGVAEPIFSNVDFSVDCAQGESIAIVGESGSGKSTLLKILASLNQPSEGRLEVDGRSVESFGLLEYRNNIGAVFADDGLVKGSVFDNVTLFDPARTLDAVTAALQLVDIHEVIEDLPQGLATQLSGESALLSTGQRRRLLAARAICRRPQLLLFDEITANLDPQTEAMLLGKLMSLPGGKVFVTHSMHLCQYTDRVFSMQDGRLMPVTLN